jgi:hypothetical protein
MIFKQENKDSYIKYIQMVCMLMVNFDQTKLKTKYL